MNAEDIDNMQPGRELDAEIAHQIMRFEGCVASSDGSGMQFPPFSTDIAAAWLVVEKLRESGACFDLCDQAFTKLRLASFTQPITNIAASAYAQSDALAICRAALKAVAGEQSEVL